jgi:hypothetical protein
MKEIDFKGIVNSIKEASASHLALVSFFLFPIAFKYWIDSITSLFPGLQLCGKIIISVLIVLIYLVCLIWIVVENGKKNEQKLIRDKILARLIANNWKSMSFKSAKKGLGDDCTDLKIIATIESFPRTLRHVRITDLDENQQQRIDADGNLIFLPGVGRLDLFD